MTAYVESFDRSDGAVSLGAWCVSDEIYIVNLDQSLLKFVFSPAFAIFCPGVIVTGPMLTPKVRIAPFFKS